MARRRLGLIWGALLVVLVALSGASWWVGANSQTPTQAAARASAPEPSWITAPVERREVSPTVILRGTVVAESEFKLIAPSTIEGIPVITSGATPPETVVSNGTRLVEISGRPVFAMEGSVPAYRTLRPGMTGDDVAQMQAALTEAGFEPETDGVFGPQTKAAVSAFYDAAGYDTVDVSETFESDLAMAKNDLAAAQAAVDAAETAVGDASDDGVSLPTAQADVEVASAERALAEARRQRDSSIEVATLERDAADDEVARLQNDTEATQASIDQATIAARQAQLALDGIIESADDQVTSAEEALWLAALSRDDVNSSEDQNETAARAELDQATIERDAAADVVDALIEENGPTIPLGEFWFVPSLPAVVDTSIADVGPVDPQGDDSESAAIVVLVSGDVVVEVLVPPESLDATAVDDSVALLNETTGAELTGVVAEIAAEPATAADGRLGYPVRIVGVDEVRTSMIDSNLRVTLTPQGAASAVLAVPVAAVSATASGATVVSVLDGSSPLPREVEVATGASADGFIEVTPVGTAVLDEGDMVVVGR